MSDLRKVGALWRSKKGTCYTGTLDVEAVTAALKAGETRLLLFKVREKRERGPDLEVFAAPDTRRAEGHQTWREETPARAPYSGGPLTDDDIPF